MSKTFKFKSFEDALVKEPKNDANLQIPDFEKLGHTEVSHVLFRALDAFLAKNKRMPEAWHVADALELINLAKDLHESWKKDKFDDIKHELKLAFQFAFTARGTFNPLCAFFGGFVAQEIVKAVTGKFSPCAQIMYYNTNEVIPEFEIKEEFLTTESAAFT